jgi:hypothetical protein
MSNLSTSECLSLLNGCWPSEVWVFVSDAENMNATGGVEESYAYLMGRNDEFFEILGKKFIPIEFQRAKIPFAN